MLIKEFLFLLSKEVIYLARLRSNIKSVCQNKDCSYYRRNKGKNMTKQGTNTAGHQRFFCFHCRRYSVETKGTPLYNKKLSERKIKQICKEFAETRGIRATERMVHVHRDTVSRLLNDLGDHAREMTNYLVHDLGLSTYEVDEILTVVKKNRDARSKIKMNSLDKKKLSSPLA